MKRWAYALCGIIIISFIVVTGEKEVCASSKRAETKKTYLFVIPDGGISSCTVDVVYTEDYTKSGENISYKKRERWYTASYVYVTEKPSFKIGNVVHKKSNGNKIKTFSKWTKTAGLFPGNVDVFGTANNVEKATYKKKSSNTGELIFSTSCSGATVPIITGKAKIKL